MSTRHGGISRIKDHFDITSKKTGLKSDGTVEVPGENGHNESDGRVTLYNCLKQFSKREQLSENDKYYCKNAKSTFVLSKSLIYGKRQTY